MTDDPKDEAFEIAAAHFFAGDGDQLELFERSADFFSEQVTLRDAGVLGARPRNPQYTAQTLKKNKPETYNLVVWMRLQAMPLRHTAEIAHVCTNTVAAVDREIEKNSKVETVRKLLAADMRSLARLGADRLREILIDRDQADLDEGKLANILKHTVQMSELLEGNATERVEWNPEKRERTSYEDYIQQAIPVDAEEIGPSGEKTDQREAADRAGQVESPTPADSDEAGTNEYESLDSDGDSQ